MNCADGEHNPLKLSLICNIFRHKHEMFQTKGNFRDCLKKIKSSEYLRKTKKKGITQLVRPPYRGGGKFPKIRQTSFIDGPLK